MTTHWCPVCWQRISPTRAGNIHGHWDSRGELGDVCPMSGESYELAYIKSNTNRAAS